MPALVNHGFDGPIYATNATRDLCAAMLTDAAMIQASDAKFINKLIDKGESDMERSSRSTTSATCSVLARMVTLPYPASCPSPTASGSTSTMPGTCWAAPSPCSTSRRTANSGVWCSPGSGPAPHAHPA
ncbi:MAG: hypothetical protein IPM35_18590 [Myxococcales bacterium]|nr:hypothetical protein [Myxococcales bacterium]